MKLRNTIASLALLLVAGASNATTIVYNTAASFQAALQPGAYLEPFNYANGIYSVPAFFSDGGGNFLYALDTTSHSVYIDSNANSALTTVNANDAITITFFGNNITAVGGQFFIENQLDNLGIGTVNLNLNDGTSVSYVFNGNAPKPFVGFTSTTPFTSLTISKGAAANRFVSMDNFVVGTAAVPEPGSIAIIAGLGVSGLGMLARRKRNR